MKYDELNMFDENSKEIKMTESEQKKVLALALSKLGDSPQENAADSIGSPVELRQIENVQIKRGHSFLKWAAAAAALLMICGGAVFAAVKLGNINISPAGTTAENVTTHERELPTPDDSIELLAAEFEGTDAEIIRECASSTVFALNGGGCLLIRDSLVDREFLNLLMRMHNPEMYTDDYTVTFEFDFEENGEYITDYISVYFVSGKCYVTYYSGILKLLGGGISNNYGITRNKSGELNTSEMFFGGNLKFVTSPLDNENRGFELSIPIKDVNCPNRDIYVSEDNYFELINFNYDLNFYNYIYYGEGSDVISEANTETKQLLWGKYSTVICDENNVITDFGAETWIDFISRKSGTLAVYKPSSNELYILRRANDMLLLACKDMTTGRVVCDSLDRVYTLDAAADGEGEQSYYLLAAANELDVSDINSALVRASEQSVESYELAGERLVGFTVSGKYGAYSSIANFEEAAKIYGYYSVELLEFAVNDFFGGWINEDVSVLNYYAGATDGAMQTLVDNIAVENYSFVETINEYIAVVEADFIDKKDGRTVGSGRWNVTFFGDTEVGLLEQIKPATGTVTDADSVIAGAFRDSTGIESGVLDFAYTFSREYGCFETVTDFKGLIETKPLHFGLYHILRSAARAESMIETATPEYMKKLAERVFGVENLNIDFTEDGLYNPETGILQETGHGGQWMYMTDDSAEVDGNICTLTITYYADNCQFVPAKTMKYVIRTEEDCYIMQSVELLADYGLDPLYGSV